MTKLQQELLQFIKAFMATKGYAPSFVEMQQAMAMKSKSQIHRLVQGLEERGRIRRIKQRNRAIEIVADPHFPEPPVVRPKAIKGYSNREMAAEAVRRGLILGRVIIDDTGNRKFRRISC